MDPKVQKQQGLLIAFGLYNLRWVPPNTNPMGIGGRVGWRTLELQCSSIAAKVFERLSPPYFRSDAGLQEWQGSSPHSEGISTFS